MTLTASSTLSEAALAVGNTLRKLGIRAVLTGGACASVHAGGTYVSKDIDFVLQGRVEQADLDRVMATVGFRRERDRYIHRECPFWVEFPRGPLAIGGDYRIHPTTVRGRAGRSLALTPTDSCRDRLAAFYHWNDRQSLEVAVRIACRRRVDMTTIRNWSRAEGFADRFEEFRTELSRARRSRAQRQR